VCTGTNGRTVRVHIDTATPPPPTNNQEEAFQNRYYEDLQAWVGAISIGMPYKLTGVPLQLAVDRSDPNQLVPSIVSQATEWLNNYGLEEEGLYRVPGSRADVDAYLARFDTGEVVQFPENAHANNLASLLVQYIKRMPDNLFTEEYAATFQHVSTDVEQDLDKRVEAIRRLMGLVPACNSATITALVYHLKAVTYYSEVNHMTAPKLAMCIYSDMASTMQFLIEHYEAVFT